ASNRVIDAFPKEWVHEVACVADQQGPMPDKGRRRCDPSGAVSRAIEGQRMTKRLRDREGGESFLITDKPLKDALRTGRPSAELRDPDRQPLFLGKNPGIASFCRAKINEDLSLTRIDGRLADPDLALQAPHPTQTPLRKEALRDDAVRPVRADQDLCPIASLVRDDLDPIRTLVKFDRSFIFVDLGTGPTRLLDEQMVEPIPHHHIGDRPRGLKKEGSLTAVGELHSVDRMLDDRLKIRFQDLLDPDR